MKKKTKAIEAKKKKPEKAFFKAVTGGGDGKPSITEIAASSIIRKHSRGRPVSRAAFMRELRKIAKQYGYSLDVADESDGMRIAIEAVYVGKTELMLPQMSKLKL